MFGQEKLSTIRRVVAEAKTRVVRGTRYTELEYSLDQLADNLAKELKMDVPFATRSRFIETCEDAIRQNRIALDRGEIVRVDFDADGGYKGKIVVTINPDDKTLFETDWQSTDVTRFPARIKAAATALSNCGCRGHFELAHTDGVLEMRCLGTN